MSFKLTTAANQHSKQATHHLMQLVMLGCLPGIGIATWFFGYGILINVVLAALFALGFETLVLKLRRSEPAFYLRDCSALVTAVLFAVSMPPGSPWWLLAIGIGFAIIVVKHCFGGLGQNPFNPAMAGYLLLLLAFPLEMTSWHIPNDQLLAGESFSPLSWYGLQQSLLASFPMLIGSGSSLLPNIDGLAMATPLIEFKMAGNSALLAALESGAAVFDRASATGWELVNLGYLLGGLFLLFKRVISWHIPLSIVATIGVMSSLFYAPGSYALYGTPYLHLFGSATMLGAFFIATDPVSSASTRRGKLLYGFLIGCSIYAIRVWGSYPDSVAIAVLFGNCCAPLLDRFSRPRIYGHHKTRPLQNSELQS